MNLYCVVQTVESVAAGVTNNSKSAPLMPTANVPAGPVKNA